MPGQVRRGRSEFSGHSVERISHPGMGAFGWGFAGLADIGDPAKPNTAWKTALRQWSAGPGSGGPPTCAPGSH